MVVANEVVVENRRCEMNEMLTELLNAPNRDLACIDLARKTLRAAARTYGPSYNVFTGGYFIYPSDKISREVEKSVPRILALAHFGFDGPFGIPLPLNYRDREELNLSERPTLVLWALFARSLEANDFNYNEHPTFASYAAGALISERGRRMVDEHAFLLSDYPPNVLAGLDVRKLLWGPMATNGVRNKHENR